MVSMFDAGRKFICSRGPDELEILAANQTPFPVSEIVGDGVKTACFCSGLVTDEPLNCVEAGSGLPAASHNRVVDRFRLERGLATLRSREGKGAALTLKLYFNRPSLHPETAAVAREAVFEDATRPEAGRCWRRACLSSFPYTDLRRGTPRIVQRALPPHPSALPQGEGAPVHGSLNSRGLDGSSDRMRCSLSGRERERGGGNRGGERMG